MIALYMDENVEGQIVRGLQARGIDVLTAEEDGYQPAIVSVAIYMS